MKFEDINYDKEARWPKLRPSVKKAWIEALMSGDYKQGNGQLRTEDNKFCCLGVLCNLHAEANPHYAKYQDDPTSYEGESEFPPQEVYDWAFMKGQEAISQKVSGYSIEDVAEELAHVNDCSANFKQIARIIDEKM